MSINIDNNNQNYPMKFFRVEAGSLQRLNELGENGKLFSGFWSKYSNFITDGALTEAKEIQAEIREPEGQGNTERKSFFHQFQDLKDKHNQKTISQDSRGAWGDPHYDLVGLNGERIKFDHMGVKGNTYNIFEGDNLKVEGTYAGYNLKGSRQDFVDVANLDSNQFNAAKTALNNVSLGFLDDQRLNNAAKIANGIKDLKLVDQNLTLAQKQQINDENNKIKEQNKQFLQSIGVNMSPEEAAVIKKALSSIKGLNENKLTLIDSFSSDDHKALKEEIAIMGDDFDPKNVTVIGKTTITAGSDKVTFALPDADSKTKEKTKAEIAINGKVISGDGTFDLSDGSTLIVQNGQIRIESAEKDSAINIKAENSGITVDPEGTFYRMGGMIGDAIKVGRALQRSEADKYDVNSGYNYLIFGDLINNEGKEAIAQSVDSENRDFSRLFRYMR